MKKIFQQYQNSFDETLNDDLLTTNTHTFMKRVRDLTQEEKKYLLATERGDIATVKRYLEDASNLEYFDLNITDPLGRSALHIAIEYENIEMIQLLLNYNIDIGESILIAINEEFVEAVEVLLNYADQQIIAKNKSSGSFDSELQNNENELSKSFTPDITPLILASHKDNYEIVKMLLDRGETISEPHDVRCSCQDCIKSRADDSLRYSRSRINAYKALASPSFISLSSKDPILTAFQLSWELKRLSKIENEFKNEYELLSEQCQEYASALINETRTSKELEIILNYDHETIPGEVENESNTLGRLKLAIKCKQKKFVAHPHCQQLLVKLWYEGISGFRRRNIFVKFFVILALATVFPFLSIIYIIFPSSKCGQIINQPFIKFVCHSASYIIFLGLLSLTSLRINSLDPSVTGKETHKEMRGPTPTPIEWMIYCYVASFIWNEIKQLYTEGLIEYLHDLWNLIDFITNTLYISTIVLKLVSYILVQAEMANGKYTYRLNREHWDSWDPTLISEGIFAAANIFSCLKLVYIFTINPHLGPLQISVGRIITDLMKFSIFLGLVVFSFGCGINQLYWYYTQMRNKQCEEKAAANLFANKDEKDECHLKIKYFSDLFESVQSLYWAIFGLIEKDRLDSLHRKHTFTMFIGLLMFGVYSAIMVVLVNMLIAMMSNSYQKIANKADEEWKFARSKLWVSYFDEENTLPVPFNLIPTSKSIYKLFKWIGKNAVCSYKAKHKQKKWLSVRKLVQNASEREYKYQIVIQELVKRYIMRKQQRDLHAGVTEDDMNEIKQDISGLRFELLEIFKNNDFKIDVIKQAQTKRKRGKLNLEKAMNKKFFNESNIENINIKKAINEIDRKLETRMKLFSRRDSKKSGGSSIKSSEKINPIKFEQNDLEIVRNDNASSIFAKKNTQQFTKMAQTLKKYAPNKFKKQLSETADLIDKNPKDSKNLVKQDENISDFSKSKEFSDIIVPVTISNKEINESESFVERFAEV